MVLGDALAVVVHEAEVGLCAGMRLFSGAAVPLGGFGMVLWDALAVVVHEAEVVLCAGEPLFSGEAVPLGGFGMVLGDARATVVHHAKPKLSIHVSPLSRLTKLLQVRRLTVLLARRAFLGK